MSGFSRMKRVTDPLGDKVKAHITGREVLSYFSSGSEHSADHADDDGVAASPSLSDLVFGYHDDVVVASPENDSDSEHDEVEELPVPIFKYTDHDLFRNVLLSCISKALEIFSSLKSEKLVLQRNVMAYLRNFGYNAAVCKTKWESSGGLKAGNYEFIDIIKSDSTTRYFVEIDFAAEFEIARPTNQYKRLLQSLPNVFVGKFEELKQILKLMSDAARRSLKFRGLHIPPWRKHRFMQNKWFGPYKRTINVFPSLNTSAWLSQSKQSNGVKCRTVGFHASAVNGNLLFPATTRS